VHQCGKGCIDKNMVRRYGGGRSEVQPIEIDTDHGTSIRNEHKGRHKQSSKMLDVGESMLSVGKGDSITFASKQEWIVQNRSKKSEDWKVGWGILLGT
jgi:hypothetical protein